MLKKIILICISLLFITSCIDDREVEKATESREIEKTELELKREKTIKKVAEEYENKYFEKVELQFQKALKENAIYLKISNEELFDFFKIRFLYRTYGGHYRFSTLEEYLRTGKYEKFRNEVKTLLKNSVSFRDLKEENSYHLFVMGMVAVMYENYYIKPNYESRNCCTNIGSHNNPNSLTQGQ